MVLIRSMVITASNAAAALRIEQMPRKFALAEWLGPSKVHHHLNSGFERAFLQVAQNEDQLSKSEEATAHLLDLLDKTDEEALPYAAEELAHKRNRKLFYTHPAQMRAIWHRFLDRLDWERRKKLLKGTLYTSVDDDTIVSSVLLIDVLTQYEIEQAFKPIVNYRMASKKVHLFGNTTDMLQVIIEQAIAPLIELFSDCKQANLYGALKLGKKYAFQDAVARNDEDVTVMPNLYGSSFFFDQMGNVLFNRYLEQIQMMINQITSEQDFQSVYRVTDENYSEHASKLLDSLLPHALQNLFKLPKDAFKMNSMKKFLVWCRTAGRVEALTNITLPDELKTFIGEDHIQEHLFKALTTGVGCHFSTIDMDSKKEQQVQAYIENVVIPNIRSAKTKSLDLSSDSQSRLPSAEEDVEVDIEADAPVQEQSDAEASSEHDDAGPKAGESLLHTMTQMGQTVVNGARQVYDDVVSESQLALRRSQPQGQQPRVLKSC